MMKAIRNFALLTLVLFVSGLATAERLYPDDKKLCCISGKYVGYQLNYAKPNCPAPVREKFMMVIKQDRFCGAKLSGTVTDSLGLVSNWTGTLRRGIRGFCTFEGTFLTPGSNTVKFTGSFFFSMGKRTANGTWIEIGSTDPCRGSGTWRMTQN